MSTNKKGNLVRDIPEGWTEEEIDASAEEAFKKGELKSIDVLGNEEPFTQADDIFMEMLNGAEKPIAVEYILRVVKHLQGKVLTILDATFTDEKRIKYVKDLVKDSFSSSSQWIMETAIREFETDLSKPTKK